MGENRRGELRVNTTQLAPQSAAKRATPTTPVLDDEHIEQLQKRARLDGDLHDSRERGACSDWEGRSSRRSTEQHEPQPVASTSSPSW